MRRASRAFLLTCAFGSLLRAPEARGAGAPPPAEGKLAGPPASSHPNLELGRFGRALNAGAALARIDVTPAFYTPPLTVECWAKLESQGAVNILLAVNPKESADHWRLSTSAGGGD